MQMQMPILSYPNLSQFLQLHQNQHDKHLNLQQNYPAAPHESSEASMDTSRSQSPIHYSPSSSPTLQVSDKTTPGKSFTIDAILGLSHSHGREPISFHSAFHPQRLGPISRFQNNKQGNSLYPNIPHKEKSFGEGKKCSGKSKRVRTIFTPEQLERLEAEFERQQYMVGPERLYLAHTLHLTEAQVKVWFQNRRIKWRKQHLEIQQQKLAVFKERQQVDQEGSDDSSTDAKYPSFVQENINQQTVCPQINQTALSYSLEACNERPSQGT